MKNIVLLSGCSNKTFRVILVRVKYIEKYWNVNKVRKHSATPSYCMNPIKITLVVCYFLHLNSSTKGKLLSRMLNANLYLLLSKDSGRQLNSKFSVRRKVFRVAYFQFYNTAFYRRPLPA